MGGKKTAVSHVGVLIIMMGSKRFIGIKGIWCYGIIENEMQSRKWS